MTLSGTVVERHWTVSADTSPVPGGFACTIRVSHDGAGGSFAHEFKHFKTFCSEREAVLDGLREGMLWIEQKLSKTFSM
ncbi:UDP-glucose 4-epimerase [Trinickia caryophylli]|uniref:UDP-glucose 4-epimerase n=1 Tax=Trinickia caryophylli TaxID=28094 RepID=A0A1X7GG22_TRICW|nr:UDP-glucose 4-epimerase [Trinickia caryophylli]PMS08750.1 UDP-glucose 4-epimerase [Trinickia caryophylli]TRX13904.1 UDP-glucose 4-epimerase [Trinickia caryophylli]WQE15495.1 UDP-glucose 4-epimerase [Trinickia caryophylli]SMF69184.1 hypothetical protein SAMN06295900_115137 [Trinickia caryophylli]GLU33759.1 hypothetical protein Busp01_36010 [Trinickia caryophylli]